MITLGCTVPRWEREVRLHDHRFATTVQPMFRKGKESDPHEAIMTRKAMKNKKKDKKEMDTQQPGFAGGHPPNY